MEGTPAGAMRWHGLLSAQTVSDRPWCQESTVSIVRRLPDAIRRDAIAAGHPETPHGIEEDIDDPRMRTCTEDDDALALHMHGYVAFIHDQWIRLPWLVGGTVDRDDPGVLISKLDTLGISPLHVETVIQEETSVHCC